jgi:hypothetical protein
VQASFRAMHASYARWGQPGERYDLGFGELKDERILVGSPQEVAERMSSTGTSSTCPSWGSVSITRAWTHDLP